MLRFDPALEVIVCAPTESFRWNVHDYPHVLAKWHYHPEYELHLIQDSAGRMMIGDYVGPFEKGCLVLSGPNLPHNWVSELGGRSRIPDRDMLIQFSGEVVGEATARLPELGTVRQLLNEAAFGLEFLGATAEHGAGLLRAIGQLRGPARLFAFLELLVLLAANPRERRTLSRVAPSIGQHTPQSQRFERVMRHVHEHFCGDLTLGEVAAVAGMEVSTFSRYFKKNTGHTFNRFVNQLRVHHACAQLIRTNLTVTEICFEAGFNNTANFNRQFRAFCGTTPTDYRREAQTIATTAATGKGPQRQQESSRIAQGW